jgi:hypothetical protein
VPKARYHSKAASQGSVHQTNENPYRRSWGTTATVGVNNLETATKRLALLSSAALRTSNCKFSILYLNAERSIDLGGMWKLDYTPARLGIRPKNASMPSVTHAVRSEF